MRADAEARRTKRHGATSRWIENACSSAPLIAVGGLQEQARSA
jgi:hypothetical protein